MLLTSWLIFDAIPRIPSKYILLHCIFFRALFGFMLLKTHSNQDTRDLDVGTYYWDLRIVTDPEKDEEGNVRCDDPGDNVYSIFSGVLSEVDWVMVASASVLAALLSVLNSIATGLPEAPKDKDGE